MHKKRFEQPPRRVALFVTCMVDMMYPDVGMSTVDLLEGFGIDVIFPEEQTCCGQPAFNAGFRDESRQLARRFIDIFEPLLYNGIVDAVVAPSGSCTTMISHFYPSLFDKRDPFHRRAETLAQSTFELTKFLVDVLGVTDVDARYSGKVTYHACCHLLRELRVDAQPRELLSNIEGAEIVPLEGSEECCGFGGLFSIKNAGISAAMGDRKVRNIGKSGADVVAMCDVSCMTHINGLLEKRGAPKRAIHVADLLVRQEELAVDEADAKADTKPHDAAVASGFTNPESNEPDTLTDSPPKRLKPPPPPTRKSNVPPPAPTKKQTVQPEQKRPRRWQDY